MDNSIKAIRNFENALEVFTKAQVEMNKVSEYYGSKDWFSDIEARKILKDIKAGILSEDLVYNTLIDNRNLAIRMLEVGTEILKKR